MRLQIYKNSSRKKEHQLESIDGDRKDIFEQGKK